MCLNVCSVLNRNLRSKALGYNEKNKLQFVTLLFLKNPIYLKTIFNILDLFLIYRIISIYWILIRYIGFFSLYFLDLFSMYSIFVIDLISKQYGAMWLFLCTLRLVQPLAPTLALKHLALTRRTIGNTLKKNSVYLIFFYILDLLSIYCIVSQYIGFIFNILFFFKYISFFNILNFCDKLNF